MKLTLWFLNRITEWEVERQGELGKALAGARHDVRLGRRVLATTPAVPGGETVDLAVNNSEPSFRGELMHEGHQQAADGMKTVYDEYFMPIPLKCLGRPDYDAAGNPRLTPFWKSLIPAEKQAEFLRILTPLQSENHCFDPALVDGYWEPGNRPVKGISELANEFSDVRMNTSPRDKSGYYQMLQEAKQKHGPNILIGYSQGGAVVNYLAYVDEHFVSPEKRCVAGVISVQGALRGSTLAMQSRAQAVLDSLVEMVHSVWGEHLFELMLHPEIRQRVSPLLEPGHKVTIDQVEQLLDNLYALAKPDKGLSRFIRTARKWLSGLGNEKQLAFWDLDPIRLNHPGSVMEALDNHPLMSTLCGAVAGANFHLEPLAYSAIQYKYSSIRYLGPLAHWLLHRLLDRAEVIYRSKTFDMMPEPLTPPNDALARLRSEWFSKLAANDWSIRNDVGIPARASDCVIPTASQLLRPVPGNRPGFLGNYVNADASHLSGAVLNDKTPNDIDYVKQLLGCMREQISYFPAQK